MAQELTIDGTVAGDAPGSLARQRVPEKWHVITGEYPPQAGGVSDYSYWLAKGLAEVGDEVHMWCPPCDDPQPEVNGVTVHRALGRFAPSDFARMAGELDRCGGAQRILVQWVPHSFGYRTMNIGFCWWLWRRAAQGHRVELMVHEPYLSFRAAAWRQNAAAFVHRLMATLLLRAASQVWISIPAWENLLKPYAFGRRLDFRWLPIPSNVPRVADIPATQAVRRRYCGDRKVLIGHFGTYAAPVTTLLEPILLALKSARADSAVLLIGHGSEAYCRRLIAKDPGFAEMLQATGDLAVEELSSYLAACDLLIQPYPDGISTRRTSAMAGLSHGKPIVSTSGALTEPLWNETEAVALTPARDAARFAEKVNQLLADGERLRRAGVAAEELYRTRFDMSHVVAALRHTPEIKQQACAS